jgi:hypothetical protein
MAMPRPFLMFLSAVVVACSHAVAPTRPESGWPNEPAGFTVVTDWGLDEELPRDDARISGSPGWSLVTPRAVGSQAGFTAPGGRVQRAEDRSARHSPPFVYEMIYPEGMVEGYAPATVYYESLNVREVYVGFWWKTSSPFDLGPNGNKIAFLFNGGGDRGGQQFLALFPDRRLHVTTEYPGNVAVRRPNASDTRVALGEWHQVEWYSNLNTGAMKWWMDGVLIGNHGDVTNPVPFDMFQFSPTWGGNTGARKKQTDRYWFDHVRVSVPR